MINYEDLSEEGKRICDKIESRMRELLSKPPVSFPLTMTLFEKDGVKVTATYNKPNRDGTVDVIVEQERSMVFLHGIIEKEKE